MRRVLFALLSVPMFAACAVETGDATDPGTDQSADELAYDGGSYKWIYDGPLPSLEKPSVTVSLLGHTARVTGTLPAGFDVSKLPFYADAYMEGGRTKVAVVYPVATGATANAPGSYPNVFGVPYVPSNDHATWGGFPFLEYNHQRGIAMHGPITHDDAQWKLIRGPVSHGCNRMQGEHVVEVAQLLGIDMHKPHSTGDRAELDVPVDVITTWDSWQGKYVDVDYPATSAVKRPPVAKSKLFRTWSSDDFPAVVCKYNKNFALTATHCNWAGKNRRSLKTGALL